MLVDQALPPRALFGNLPVLVARRRSRPPQARGRSTRARSWPPSSSGRSAPGRCRLLQAAKDAGILDPGTDFTGGAMPMGAAAARLQIVVDGVDPRPRRRPERRRSRARRRKPARAVPGTPAAFARFWYQLLDMAGWLGPELGPEQPHVPASYAVIIGPPPEPWEGVTPVVWPVRILPCAFGAPVRGEPGTRCGIAAGDLGRRSRTLRRGDAADPVRGYGNGQRHPRLTVRALLPGDEDPCALIVGSDAPEISRPARPARSWPGWRRCRRASPRRSPATTLRRRPRRRRRCLPPRLGHRPA